MTIHASMSSEVRCMAWWMASVLLCTACPVVSAQTAIEVGGLYQGENLLVVNETNPDGVGFCCFEVRVNGQETTD